jgi:hypothetical protein
LNAPDKGIIAYLVGLQMTICRHLETSREKLWGVCIY